MVKSASGKEGYRSFTIVQVGKHGGCKTKFNGGRYKGRNPAAAARKAFTELCRIKRIRGVCTLVVTLQETTQGSKKNVVSYRLRRRKLDRPLIMMEGTNKEYVIEYTTAIKSTNVPQDCRKPGQSRGRKKKKTSRKGRKSGNNVRKQLSKMKNMLGM